MKNNLNIESIVGEVKVTVKLSDRHIAISPQPMIC